MEKNKFVKEVERKLLCKKGKKQEICRDLTADIEAALEQGEDWASIEKRMGTPAEIAAEFNENLSPEDRVKSHKKLFLALGIALAVIVALGIFITSQMPKAAELGSSGYFTEESVREQSLAVIGLVSEENWDVLLEDYGIEAMQTDAVREQLIAAKETLGSWGAYEKITSEYMYEMTASGTTMAVAQIVVLFEEKSITFTLSFDVNGKLAGIYMK